MILMRFHATSTLTFYNYNDMVTTWRSYDPQARELVGTVRCTARLTKTQLRRLPRGLRAKLSNKDGDSIAWLEALYKLDSGKDRD